MNLLNNTFFYKIINLCLRIGGMGSKFLMFTLLSKYFSNIEFGNYSLITSIITIIIFVLGFDFYNFSIRDILKEKNTAFIKQKLFSTFFLYLVIYLIFFLIGVSLFSFIDYTKDYVFLIVLLCITEHVSQEIYRLLIGFNRVLFANVLLFFRTFVWSAYLFALMYKKVAFSTGFIFKIWLFFDVLTILIPFFIFIKIKDILSIKIDFNWVKKGLKISVVFFISTIFLKTIEYSNRFIVDAFLDKQFVAIYNFYSNIAILITVYINTIVISFELPNIIKAETKKVEIELFKKLKKSLLIQTLIICAGLVLIIHPILIWQDKKEFQEYLPILYFMIVGVAFMNYSLYYHFKLYVNHLDFKLLQTIVITGILSLLISICLTKYLGVYGSSIAFMLSGIILYINRFIVAKKI